MRVLILSILSKERKFKKLIRNALLVTHFQKNLQEDFFQLFPNDIRPQDLPYTWILITGPLSAP